MAKTTTPAPAVLSITPKGDDITILTAEDPATGKAGKTVRLSGYYPSVQLALNQLHAMGKAAVKVSTPKRSDGKLSVRTTRLIPASSALRELCEDANYTYTPPAVTAVA